MVVSNLLFDVILFGALLLAALLDSFFPILHGGASLLAVGGATYIAAQEWCDAAQRRNLWTQESLATSLALSVAGFIYFWWRNQSDLSLLVLSIGLMMAALMVTIALIASLGHIGREKTPAPLGGFLLTSFGAILLGLMAGSLMLALGRDAATMPLYMKALLIGFGLILWKLRENLRPPAPYTLPTTVAPPITDKFSAPEVLPDSPAASAARPALIPQRGTLLDRFIPALVLGAILFLASRQNGALLAPAASASNASTAPASSSNP